MSSSRRGGHGPRGVKGLIVYNYCQKSGFFFVNYLGWPKDYPENRFLYSRRLKGLCKRRILFLNKGNFPSLVLFLVEDVYVEEEQSLAPTISDQKVLKNEGVTPKMN